MNSYTLSSFPRERGGRGGRRQKVRRPAVSPTNQGVFFGGGGESSGRRKKKRHFGPRRHTFCCAHRDKVSLLYRGGGRPKIPTFSPDTVQFAASKLKADLIATVPHRKPQQKRLLGFSSASSAPESTSESAKLFLPPAARTHVMRP